MTSSVVKLVKPLRLLFEQLLEKRNKVATENFVRHIVVIGREAGYNLGDGDRCFIHPTDIPPTVKLKPGMPVIESTAPAIVPGLLCFLKRKDIPEKLMYPPIRAQRSNEVH